MSFTPTFRDHAFDPETIELMSLAYARASTLLGLGDQDDYLAHYVARTVVELARSDFHGADVLAAAVMERLEDESVIGWNGEHFADAAHAPQPTAQPAE
jgi:hypothetical protein